MTLTNQLLKLRKQGVGIQEAALLFASEGGKTISELSDIMQDDTGAIRGRINALRCKGIMQSEINKKGYAVYIPTQKGEEIIKNTIEP